MNGGAGNDTYVVDDAGDTITELTTGGSDLVKALIDYSLFGANLENLTLSVLITLTPPATPWRIS